MTTRATTPLIAVLLLASCGDGSTGVLDGDAGLEDATLDSGVRDGGDDGGDAGDASAPTDGGEDAGEDLPWKFFLEGDECDLLSQNCPFAGHTCRREHLGEGEFGAATCVDYGALLTANPTPCNQTTNLCMKGLFCLGARCLRPCDPDGDACPNTDHGNSPQTCVEASDYPQPYCEWWDI